MNNFCSQIVSDAAGWGVWGTQGSRSERKEHIGRNEKTHMVFDQRDEGTPFGSYSNG